ncbi:pyridoxal kinase [Saccharomyces cerevisiae]|nr:pyridoxal kinase [Saccharomyces cerevisiae]
MPRLLATQSHVVHGYVGNKAATFPLQCLGWDVDCCNSVQFSNHTGYGLDKVFGTITRETDLKELLSGLFDNFSQDYQALLSGYLPNKNSVRCMGTYYAKFKEANPEMIWLMDPVMGDEGQLYVSEDVIPEYRKLALSPKQLVDIITPNQFELEILYGGKSRLKNI